MISSGCRMQSRRDASGESRCLVPFSSSRIIPRQAPAPALDTFKLSPREPPLRTDFDLYFHLRANPIEDGYETIHSKPSQIRIADARKVGGGYSAKIMPPAHTQFLPIERFDNLHSQD